MLTLVRAFWKSLIFLMLILGIFWLPKDVQDYGEAAKPWRRAWAMVDQNLALWAIIIALGVWLVWTDARPFWRARFGPKFPARHAAILEELANALAEIKQLTMTVPRGHDRVVLSVVHAHDTKYNDARGRASNLIEQILYDRPTADSARDFIKVCLRLHDAFTHSGDHSVHRRELKRISPPLFKALHSGKSVNRDAIPWPQWILGTEP